MTLQEVKIGTRLELEMLSKNGERVGNTLVSQLLEHQEDGTVVISAPISESRVVFVPAGITIRLTFAHQLHGMLGFTALVISREYRGKIAVLIIQPDDNIEKIQRRMHYRLDIIVDAKIFAADNDHNRSEATESEVNEIGSATKAAASEKGLGSSAKAKAQKGEKALSSENADEVKAYTKNISGSGTCIVSDTSFPRGSEVRIKLNLSHNIQISAKCVVVRNQAVEIKKGRSYELGLKFIEISNKDQDALIRFIFEQQRMLLKKEK